MHSPDCSVGTFKFDEGDSWKRSALLQRHGRGVWAAPFPKMAVRGVDNGDVDEWKMQILIRGKWGCTLHHNSRALDVALVPVGPPRVFDAEPKKISRASMRGALLQLRSKWPPCTVKLSKKKRRRKKKNGRRCDIAWLEI